MNMSTITLSHDVLTVDRSNDGFQTCEELVFGTGVLYIQQSGQLPIQRDMTWVMIGSDGTIRVTYTSSRRVIGPRSIPLNSLEMSGSTMTTDDRRLIPTCLPDSLASFLHLGTILKSFG